MAHGDGVRVDPIEAWLQAAIADAERRGLPQLKPLLENLAQATRQLRAAEWNDYVPAGGLVRRSPERDLSAEARGAKADDRRLTADGGATPRNGQEKVR